MKKLLLHLSISVVMVIPVHATFRKFVHVKPGIENEQPKFGRYSIGEVAITQIEDDTFRVVISKGSNPYAIKRFWKILCSTPCSGDQLKFRNPVWQYEARKRDLAEFLKAGFEREQVLKIIEDCDSKLNVKTRTDIDSIELLPSVDETIMVSLEIPLDEIERTYVYRDFPMRVMDGGYYYCIDIPAFYRQYLKSVEHGDKKNRTVKFPINSLINSRRPKPALKKKIIASSRFSVFRG